MVLRQLVQDGVVNDLFVESVLGLRSLRNSVTHAEEVPNVGSAYIYAERARELRRAANAISKMREPSGGPGKDASNIDGNGDS